MKTLLCLAALLSACSLAPDYHPPDTPAPEAFKEAGPWKEAVPAAEAPRGPWWQAFGDPRLDGLEAAADAGNQSLKSALARFQRARAEAEASRAALFPGLDFSAGFTRQHNSATIASQFPKKTYNTLQLGADMSYELDLWGKVRNGVAAAVAEAAASAADREAVALSLQAELAADYFALAGADLAQSLLDRSVEDYERALQIVVDRFKGGIATESDLDQARTQWQTARTQAADRRLARARLEHAIAILVGKPPAHFSLAPAPLAAPLAAGPPALSPELPARLLERRPDIAAAERRVAAANARIGVARAAWFPDFTLGGATGVASAHSDRLFDTPSVIWSFGPKAALSLLDWGRRSALDDEARAAYDQTVADYRQTVLNAFGEVEDNLAALRQLAEESDSQAAAVDAAKKALEQAQYRYGGGLVPYLEVVVTENAALQAELTAAEIATRRMQAGVLLVKALGGGYRSDAAARAPDSTKAQSSAAMRSLGTIQEPPTQTTLASRR